jgi:SAM-dependent methyltransferase
MSIANTTQAEAWDTGDSGAHWAANQARYDRMLEPFAAMILQAAALEPRARVLDVGCGCGATTLAAARLVMPGETVGIDLSGPMLARARAGAGAGGLPNAVFQQGDAQVYPFEAARFDAVLSRFGVMFFADPVAAFANVRAASRPGARLTFVCWQPRSANQWLLVPAAAFAEHVPPLDPAADDGPGMFGLADPDRLRQILAAAGWRDIQATAEHAQLLVGGGGGIDDTVEFIRTGSMGRTMLAQADADTVDRAVASLRAALAPFADADGVRLGAGVWLVQAVAPTPTPR